MMDNMEVGEKRGRQDTDFRPAKKIHKENRRSENALAEAVKTGQRVSNGWKEAWKLWVSAQRNPDGVSRPPPNDPYRWPREALEQFFEEIGSFFVGGSISEPPPYQAGPFPGGPPRGPPSFPPSFSDFPSRSSFRGPYRGSSAPFRQSSPSARSGSDFMGPPRQRGYKGGFGYGPPPPAARRGLVDPVLVEFIKMGQRKKQGFREIWKRFCEEHGGGTMDPSKHATPYFIGFIMYYGVDKLSNEDWAKPYLPELGSIGAPILVGVVKKGQRESESWKEKWSQFCIESGAIKKDPALHEARSLYEFVSDVGVATYGEKELMKRLFDECEL